MEYKNKIFSYITNNELNLDYRNLTIEGLFSYLKLLQPYRCITDTIYTISLAGNNIKEIKIKEIKNYLPNLMKIIRDDNTKLIREENLMESELYEKKIITSLNFLVELLCVSCCILSSSSYKLIFK